jgi:hypothetical protein
MHGRSAPRMNYSLIAGPVTRWCLLPWIMSCKKKSLMRGRWSEVRMVAIRARRHPSKIKCMKFFGI